MRSSLLTLTLGVGLVAACGDDGTNHLADAPLSDGTKAIDAESIDAATLPVTLTVTLDGSAATGVKVYFLEADSTLVSNTVTDANGDASAIVKAGGSVTAIEPPQLGLRPGATADFDLNTFAGVKPGDHLHLDLEVNLSSDPTTFDVTVPTAANATDYVMETPCGAYDLTPLPPPPSGVRARKLHPLGLPANQPTVSVTVRGCAAVEDVMIAAFDTEGNLVGSVYLPATPFTTGVPLVVAGPYVATAGVQLTLENPSTVLQNVDIDGTLFGASGLVYDTELGASRGSGEGSDELIATLSLPPSGSLSTAIEAFLISVQNDTTVFDSQQLLQWGAPADSKLIDLTTLALADYTSNAQFDATSQQLKWTVGATGLAPDVVEAEIDVSREAEGVPDGVFTWSIAAAGTETGAIQFPTLPTDVFNFVVGASDGVNVDEANTGKLPGGYDAVRANIFRFQPNDVVPLTATGTASFTSLNEELPSVRHAHRAWAPRHTTRR